MSGDVQVSNGLFLYYNFPATAFDYSTVGGVFTKSNLPALPSNWRVYMGLDGHSLLDI